VSLVVDWASPDPAGLGARLAERLRLPRPDPDDPRFALVLAGGVIRVDSTGPGGRERITAVSFRADGAGSAAPASSAPGSKAASTAAPSGVRLLGAAWATVEMQRGVREIAARLGIAANAFRAGSDDGWLGAAARVARLGGTSLVVLEPVTEGRIAAALARFGEGPVAVYLELPGPAADVVRPGPLGAGALLPGNPPWGPFTIVVARPLAPPAGDDADDADDADEPASRPPRGTING
jgi:hypothetical protein